MAVPKSVALFLAVGILAASQSGNIIRLADAPPLAIAAWRLLIAAVLLAPLAGRRLRVLRTLGRRKLALLLLAGATLAAHFVAWIAAVQHTTVANAATFFAVNPVLTATAAHFLFGERVSKRLVGSILLGLGGVLAIAAADLRFGREHLLGDGLAVLCSLLFTIYFLLGKRLRAELDSRVYVTALYGIAGICGVLCAPLVGTPLAGFSGTTWIAFLLMALVPTMVGHTSMNHALRYVDAGRISTLTLSEPLLAGLVALVVWGEPVRPATAVGYVLICLSVLLVVGERAPKPATAPAARAAAPGRG